jgi:hypothetical protein
MLESNHEPIGRGADGGVYGAPCYGEDAPNGWHFSSAQHLADLIDGKLLIYDILVTFQPD